MNLFTKFSHSISKKFLAVFTLTFAIGIVFSFAIFTFPTPAHALPEFLKPNCTASNCEFIFLAPIDFPGLNISGGKLNVGGNGASQYFKGLYTFGIAIASALAVIVIIIGGVQYSSTDAIQGKNDGKGRIQAALSGIVLALIAYTILNTINPNLVSNSFNPQPISVDPSVNQGGGAVVPVENPTQGPTGAQGELGPAGSGGATGGPVSTQYSFPKSEWNEYALQAIRNSGLMDLNPSDAARYFPNGQITEQGWVNLIAGIAREESSWNAKPARYDEDPTGSKGLSYNEKYSVGLLSLSPSDPEAKSKGYTYDDLEDPQKNLQVGVEIIARQIRQDGRINGGNSAGLTEYWSVLRRE